MQIDAGMLDELRQLAPVVAPIETAARPYYFVDANQLRGVPFGRRTCLGWCSDGQYSATFAAEVEGYRDNPGPLIALNGAMIMQDAIPGHFRRCLRSVGVHEVMHGVENTRPTEIVSLSPKEKLCQSARMERDLDAPRAMAAFDESHNAAFLRRSLHAWHRAHVKGWDIPIRGLASLSLGMGVEDAYYETLEAEAVAMAHEPYAVIDATPAPTAFTELWQRNLEFYQRMFG